jgi:transposase
MGKFSYPKFLNLKELARKSIGVDNEASFFLINSLNENLEKIEKEIEALMSMINTKLTTIPGVSIFSAATILGEIGDISKFSSPAKLIAFTGFDIAIYQSGEKEFYGKLVKRGSPLLRKTKTDKVDARKREQGKHHKVAFSAISRKLIRLIYHIESNKIDFDIEQYR